jgi:hypothetical protein
VYSDLGLKTGKHINRLSRTEEMYAALRGTPKGSTELENTLKKLFNSFRFLLINVLSPAIWPMAGRTQDTKANNRKAVSRTKTQSIIYEYLGSHLLISY